MMIESPSESGTRGARWRLDVVMPVYNERDWVLRAARALEEAARVADCDVRLIVVDDGSDDPRSRDVLEDLGRQDDVELVRQENQGRFAARRAGLARVETPYVLLLDARVEVDAASLGRIRDAVEQEGHDVWTFDVAVGRPSIGALFWFGITKIWWREYFRDKRPVSFGVDEFDRFPKGSGAFFAPTDVLEKAVGDFESLVGDARLASDDTRLLRNVAAQRPIRVSPAIGCRHYAKSGVRPWSRQCYFRGTTFVDGYVHDRGRAQRLLAVGAGAVGLGTLVAVRSPRVALLGLLAGSSAAGMATRSCGGTAAESASVTVLTAPFGVLFGAGVLRGLKLASGAPDDAPEGPPSGDG